MRILGIDPSSTATGYGVIEQTREGLRHLAHGTLRPPRSEGLAGRLAFLQRGLEEVIVAHRPDRAAVERVFVARSPRSALVLGQARGAALAALGAARLPVHEYAPQQIKQAVVGTGSAEKRQVLLMVRRLLGLERVVGTDASDALATAICHAHAGRLALAARAGRRRRAPRASSHLVVRRVR